MIYFSAILKLMVAVKSKNAMRNIRISTNTHNKNCLIFSKYSIILKIWKDRSHSFSGTFKKKWRRTYISHKERFQRKLTNSLTNWTKMKRRSRKFYQSSLYYLLKLKTNLRLWKWWKLKFKEELKLNRRRILKLKIS